LLRRNNDSLVGWWDAWRRESLHPTHRDETAMNGAPGLMWWCDEGLHSPLRDKTAKDGTPG